MEDPTFPNNFLDAESIRGVPYFPRGVVDVNFKVQNSSLSIREIWVENRNPFTKIITAYLIEGNPAHARKLGSWAKGEFQTRELNGATVFFKIVLEPGLNNIVLRVEPSRQENLRLALHSPASAADAAFTQSLYGLTVYGGLVVLILSAVFINLRMRDRSYLYYIFYASTCLISNMFMTGWMSRGLEHVIESDNLYSLIGSVGSSIFGSLIGVAIFLFLNSYLDISTQNPRLSRFVKLNVAVMSLLSLFIGVALLIDRNAVYPIALARNMGGYTLCFPLTIVLYYCAKKQRYVYLLLLALLPLEAFAAFWVGGIDHEIDNSLFRMFSGGFGMILEMTLLSIALGDKVQRRLEKESASNLALSENLKTLNEELEQRVRQKTREIRSILDSVAQGLMPIEKTATDNFQVSATRSASLPKLIGETNLASSDPVGAFLSGTNLSQERQSIVQSVLLTSLGEDILQFELNTAQLPRHAHFGSETGQRYLELDWQPICDDAGRVQKILLVINDYTEQRTLEAENVQQTRTMHLMLRSIEISDQDYSEFISYAYGYLKEVEDSIDQMPHTSAIHCISAAMRPLHTLKGLARNYGFSEMSGIIHECESAFIASRNHDISPSTLSSLLEPIHSELDLFRFINETHLKRSGVKNVSVPIVFMEAWTDRLLAANPESTVRQVAHEIQKAYKKSLPQILEKDLKALGLIASNLHKPEPLVLFQGKGDFIDERFHSVLKEAFVHLLRNSIDHGIEKPDERESQGLAKAGTITIEIEQSNEKLRITYWDDGRGLNIPKIREQSKLRGISCDGLSDIAIADFIFAPGLSTKENITDISGRGIGLSSVRSKLESLHGQICLLVAEESGKAKEGYLKIKFYLELPLHDIGSIRELRVVPNR